MYSIQRTTCSEGSHHFQDLFPHLGSETGKWGLPWKIVAPCCRSKILGIIPSPFKPRCRLASSGDKLVCVDRGHEDYDNPPQGSYEMPRDWKGKNRHVSRSESRNKQPLENLDSWIQSSTHDSLMIYSENKMSGLSKAYKSLSRIIKLC